MLETQKDGYFTNDSLIPQTEMAIDIFERVHPDAKGIFLFDIAPPHRKVADDDPRGERSKHNAHEGKGHEGVTKNISRGEEKGGI